MLIIVFFIVQNRVLVIKGLTNNISNLLCVVKDFFFYHESLYPKFKKKLDKMGLNKG